MGVYCKISFDTCRFYTEDLQKRASNNLPKERRLPWLALNEVSFTLLKQLCVSLYSSTFYV